MMSRSFMYLLWLWFSVLPIVHGVSCDRRNNNYDHALLEHSCHPSTLGLSEEEITTSMNFPATTTVSATEIKEKAFQSLVLIRGGGVF